MRPLTTFRHTLATTALAAGLGLSLAPTAQADVFGFPFQFGSSNTTNVTGNNQSGVRFTALDSMTIDTLSFQLNNGSGAVDFALQADDGFGNPSGVDLTSGTVTGGAGFKSATVTPTAIVAGTTYHVVARSATGAGGLRLGLTDTVADVHTRDGSAAPNAAQIFSGNAGSSWSAFPFSSRTLIWGVSNSSTSQAQGQPYTTGTTKNFGAQIYRGQSFTQDTGSDIKLNSLTVSIRRNADAEAGDLNVSILDALTLTELYSGTLATTGDVAAATNAFVTHNIAEIDRPTLTDGVQYVLALTSRDSTATGAWRWFASQADDSSGLILGENYQGDNASVGIGVLDGLGGITSFSEDSSATVKQDAFFSMDVTPVPEPGSLALIGLGSLAMLARRKK